MISSVAALLAARLAGGVLVAGAVIALRHPVPPAYTRFLLAGAGGALTLAAAAGRNRPEAALLAVLLLSVAGLWAACRPAPGRESGRFGGRPRLLAALMILLGLAAALASPALEGGPRPAAASLTALAGALLAGSTAATMTLGHWYLVDTTLSIRPLASGAALFLGAAGLRAAVAAGFLVSGGYHALRLESPADLIYSTTALFFSFRTVTGLLAPLALAALVRATVRIRSTQSATGLLYVALILVLFGELTAIFLELLTGGALA